jgi:hypothetical protein
MREKILGQQPSQPEHTQPLQGSAEGKQSLQGPTTVDRSEQLQSSREKGQASLGLPLNPQEKPPHQQESQEAKPSEESLYKRYLKEMRTVSEKDPKLFATRAMEALEALFTERIPHAERSEKAEQQELISQLHALGGLDALVEKPNNQWWQMACQKRESQGYVSGLTTAFLALSERITGKPTSVRLPAQDEPEGNFQEGDITSKK